VTGSDGSGSTFAPHSVQNFASSASFAPQFVQNAMDGFLLISLIYSIIPQEPGNSNSEKTRRFVEKQRVFIVV